jgi:hypothetical protein
MVKPREIAHVLRLSGLLIFALAIATGGSFSAVFAGEMPAPGAAASGCDYDQRGQYYCWGGAGGSAPAPSAPAAPPDEYIAIAVADKAKGIGVSHGPGSQQETDQYALQRCATLGTDCVVEVYGVNICGALAISIPDLQLGISTNVSRKIASEEALAQCRRVAKSCKLSVAVCANDN